MDYSKMNRAAWEIATTAMVRRSGGVTSYSTTQIRKFLALAQVPDAEVSRAIDEAVQSYTPQPALQFGNEEVRGDQTPQELEKRKKKNTQIGNQIKTVFIAMDPSLRTRFMQYLIWDIKILEEAFRMYRADPIPFLRKLFAVEQVERPDELLDTISSLVKAGGYMDRNDEPRGNRKFEPRGSRR